ncbi:MAG TPA: hypothetical protein VGC16_06370 [Rhizomicrobium sp.]
MAGRQVALYFAWSHPEEVALPLDILDDRFPALFELRRLLWPRLEQFSDPAEFDQGIGGFLDNIQLTNFKLFAELASEWTGNPVRQAERQTASGVCSLDDGLLAGVDTLIIISFDSARAPQHPSENEVTAVRAFLDNPDHTLFVCPHHDIGNLDGLPENEKLARQELEFHHHGDPTIPPKQYFGDFGISLLAGLGLSVRNRFGLRPAHSPDGSPAPLEIAAEYDRYRLMEGVTTFNLHFHLPHFEMLGDGMTKLEILARQPIDPGAPPHPFAAQGRNDFDVLLQSKADVFPGRVLICDTTIWSSTVGGLDSLRRFWRNVTELKTAGA